MANDFAKLLITYLTKPKSDFYLSKLIKKIDNPKLEPYHAEELGLGTFNSPDMNFELKLANVNITGLSNIQIKKNANPPPNNVEIKISGSTVTFSADRPNTEAPPAGIPTELLFNGDLLLIPLDEADDDGEGPIDCGKVDVVIKNAEIVGTFDATSANDTIEQAQIVFSSLLLKDALAEGNIKITLNSKDIIAGIINGVINKPAAHKKLVEVINDKLKDPAVLKALNDGATSAARTALASLDE
jgi:hypothetical protein